MMYNNHLMRSLGVVFTRMHRKAKDRVDSVSSLCATLGPIAAIIVVVYV
jgi:hypothetical protein